MMSKILVITSCEECFHFDYEYYDYAERCLLLNKKIKSTELGGVYSIPEDCPLPNAEEDADV